MTAESVLSVPDGDRNRDAAPHSRVADFVEVAGLRETLAILDQRLKGYGRRVKYEWISARLLLLRNLSITVVTVVAALLAIWLTWTELAAEGIQLEPFDVTEAIEKQGFTGKIIARRVADNLTAIRNSVSTSLNTSSISTKQLGLDQNIKVPIAGISLDAAFAYLRNKFGRLKVIEGEITQPKAESVVLTLRVRGSDARSYEATPDQISVLFAKASEQIYLNLQPYVLALYRREKGDLTGAIEAAAVGARLYKGREQALSLVLWGNVLRQQRKTVEALAKYEQAIKADPRSPETHQELADTYLSQGKYDAAYAAVDTFIKLSPRSSLGHSRKSYIAWLANDYPLCRAEAQKALAIDPHDIRALSNMLFLAEIVHDYADVEKYAKILTGIPNPTYGENIFVVLPNSLAHAAIALKNFDVARVYANELIERHPSHFAGWTRMSKILIAEKKFDEAIAHARKAVEVGPNSVSAPLNLADALVESGRFEEAEQHIEATLRRLPRSAGLYATWGRMQMLQGKLDDAVAKYLRAVELAPGIPDYHLGLARAQSAAGNAAAADQHVALAMKIAPKWSMIRIVVAEQQAARGDQDGALKTLQDALRMDPKSVEALVGWGKLLQARGNVDGAKEKFRQALAIEPSNAELRRLAGS